jgi:hypothetical protein
MNQLEPNGENRHLGGTARPANGTDRSPTRFAQQLHIGLEACDQASG